MKKMIATLLLVMAVFLAGSLKVSAESKTLVLPEILKPVLMTIHDNHLYVLQDTSIYIYSLKGLKLIKKFGRKGEGPKEFMARPFGPPMTMSFYEGKLAVNSNNKLSFFDPKGEYISEMKAPTNSVFYQYKDGFLAVGPAGTEDGSVRIAFRLLAKDFKQKSMFLVTDIDFGNTAQIDMPLCAFTYNPVYKDYVVLAPETDKFIIDILDHSGKKVRRIEKTDYEKIAINETYKKATHAWFKNEFYLKQFYERNIKQRLRFRKYYPPIRDIHVNDEVMYVITFKREGELWECIRMDMKGKELGRSFVPLDRYIPYTYHSILYSVDKSKFYSLVEDEEEEVYKLHITDLK